MSGKLPQLCQPNFQGCHEMKACSYQLASDFRKENHPNHMCGLIIAHLILTLSLPVSDVQQ